MATNIHEQNLEAMDGVVEELLVMSWFMGNPWSLSKKLIDEGQKQNYGSFATQRNSWNRKPKGHCFGRRTLIVSGKGIDLHRSNWLAADKCAHSYYKKVYDAPKNERLQESAGSKWSYFAPVQWCSLWLDDRPLDASLLERVVSSSCVGQPPWSGQSSSTLNWCLVFLSPTNKLSDDIFYTAISSRAGFHKFDRLQHIRREAASPPRPHNPQGSPCARQVDYWWAEQMRQSTLLRKHSTQKYTPLNPPKCDTATPLLTCFWPLIDTTSPLPSKSF